MNLQAREEAILDAAAELLSEGSVDTLTMAAIAKRAGMSKRTLYEHFDSRDVLMGQVIARIGESIFRPLKESETELPLPERLKALLTLNPPPGTQSEKIEFLRTIIARVQAYPRLAQQMCENGRGRLRRNLQDELEKAVGDGELVLSEVQISLAADMLIGMAFYDPIPQLLAPAEPHPTEEMIRSRRNVAVDLFLSGCAAKNLGMPAGK